MRGIPDHPDIANALRTGYPYGDDRPEIVCEDCGDSLISTERVYFFDGEPVCEKCALERIEEQFSIHDIADKLGITSKTVADYAEELSENE